MNKWESEKEQRMMKVIENNNAVIAEMMLFSLRDDTDCELISELVKHVELYRDAIKDDFTSEEVAEIDSVLERAHKFIE